MKIIKYNLEINENLRNILVKENDFSYSNEHFCSPKSISAMLCQVFRLDTKAEEYVYLLALNTNQKLLGIFEISHGTVNCSTSNPREIFIRALLLGATNIVLAHNHPSGSITPSKSDILATKRIKECGELLGIPLLDHIIIIKNGYNSMKECALL